jgi:hypothetical protein
VNIFVVIVGVLSGLAVADITVNLICNYRRILGANQTLVDQLAHALTSTNEENP